MNFHILAKSHSDSGYTEEYEVFGQGNGYGNGTGCETVYGNHHGKGDGYDDGGGDCYGHGDNCYDGIVTVDSISWRGQSIPNPGYSTPSTLKSPWLSTAAILGGIIGVLSIFFLYLMALFGVIFNH